YTVESSGRTDIGHRVLRVIDPQHYSAALAGEIMKGRSIDYRRIPILRPVPHQVPRISFNFSYPPCPCWPSNFPVSYR
ncbi:unnamed protein product, partial [Mycena citricolor]